MRNYLIIFLIASTGLFSCGKNAKSAQDEIDAEPINSSDNVIISKPIDSNKDYTKYIDTKFEYTDSIGKSLIIENSLPRGGLNFTDKYEKDYVYFIFWSKITNETENPFEFKLEFSTDSYELSSSAENNFKVVLPTEQMKMDKIQLYDYGLSNLKSTLNYKLENSALLQGTINTNETSTFYIIILLKKSVEGTVRTGLRLENNKLYYRVNDKEIYAGKYNIKNLKLKN